MLQKKIEIKTVKYFATGDRIVFDFVKKNLDHLLSRLFQKENETFHRLSKNKKLPWNKIEL